MPKPPLKEPFATLESDMIASGMASFKKWRPDLHYPQSHSDMEAFVRGILQMFEIKRSPLPIKLEYEE